MSFSTNLAFRGNWLKYKAIRAAYTFRFYRILVAFSMNSVPFCRLSGDDCRRLYTGVRRIEGFLVDEAEFHLNSYSENWKRVTPMFGPTAAGAVDSPRQFARILEQHLQ